MNVQVCKTIFYTYFCKKTSKWRIGKYIVTCNMVVYNQKMLDFLKFCPPSVDYNLISAKIFTGKTRVFRITFIKLQKRLL